jgi:hypothetical protein
MPNISTKLVPDQATIRRALELQFALYPDHALVELRTLGPEYLSGFFDRAHIGEAAALAAKIGSNVHVTLNPVDPERRPATNKLARAEKGHVTSDRDLLRRSLLLLDFDQRSDEGADAATEQQRKDAVAKARECHNTLLGWGWSVVSLHDSGNGAHVLVRIDLSTDEEDTNLVKALLKALDLQFSDNVVKVDTGVYNLSRLFRLPGTVNRKGSNRELHRLARILEVAHDFSSATPRELLVALARTVPEPPPKSKPQTGGANFERFDLREYIANHFPDAVGPDDYEGGSKWLLACPFTVHTSEPRRKSAFIIEHSSGGLSAGCLRDRCRSAGHGWKELCRRYPKLKKPPHLYSIRGTGGRAPRQIHSAPDQTETDAGPNEEFFQDARSPEDRPIIDYVGGLDLKTQSAEGWKHIIERNKPTPALYAYGNLVARIDRDRVTKRAFIKECGPYEMAHQLSEVSRWRGSKGKDGWQWTQPPSPIVHNMLVTPVKPLPLLLRLTETPVFTREGRLISLPGYDAVSGIYYDPPPSLKIDPISPAPTDGDVTIAREHLLKPFAQFPFANPLVDKATCLALEIERFPRDLIPGALPLYAIDATKPGSGKTLLLRACLHPALGEISTNPPAKDEEAAAKRLLAVLKLSREVYLIDNQVRVLNSESLASALTVAYDGHFEDRILGATDQGTYSVRFSAAVTGNNLRMSPDLWRRSPTHMRLIPKQEQPEFRTGFDLDLRTWLPENRAKSIWAICTLIQNWIAKDMKPWSGQRIASFEEWSTVIGGILEAAGIEGFMVGLKARTSETDHRAVAEREFVEEWWAHQKNIPVSARTLLPLAVPNERFNLTRHTVAGNAELTAQKQAQSLGMWLAKAKDGVFAGKQIVLDNRSHGVKSYRLDPMIIPETEK